MRGSIDGCAPASIREDLLHLGLHRLDLLRRVVIPGVPATYWFDATREESRLARLAPRSLARIPSGD